MTTLLNIRLIQIRRELNNSGPGIIVILGLFSFLVYTSYVFFQKTPDAYYVTALVFSVCLSIQSYRKDKLFVYCHIQKPHTEIFAEYFVLTFPFMASSLFTVNWFCYPVLLAGLLFLPFIKFTFTQKTYFHNLTAIISASNFEWISGFRKTFLYLIPLYLLAIGFSWFRILPLFILWFITITITSFYIECEPLHILKECNVAPGKFLQQKLWQHSIFIFFLYVPVLLINTIFNIEYWILNLLFIPIQLALIWYAICLKYAGYEPNKNSIGNSIVLSLVSLGSIVPYLLPIPLIMAMVTYRKAIKNLKNYLND